MKVLLSFIEKCFACWRVEFSLAHQESEKDKIRTDSFNLLFTVVRIHQVILRGKELVWSYLLRYK